MSWSIDDGHNRLRYPIDRNQIAKFVAGEGNAQRQQTPPPSPRVRRGGAGRRGGREGRGRGQAGAQLKEAIQPVITAGESGAAIADDDRWAVDRGLQFVIANAPLRLEFALFVVVVEGLAAIQLVFQDGAAALAADERRRDVMKFANSQRGAEFEEALRPFHIGLPRIAARERRRVTSAAAWTTPVQFRANQLRSAGGNPSWEVERSPASTTGLAGRLCWMSSDDDRISLTRSSADADRLSRTRTATRRPDARKPRSR